MDIQGGGFKFNEGMYQMERIHLIQSRMNICKSFCLQKDNDTGMYGFQTWFTLLNTLYLEFVSKLSQEDVDEINLQRKKLKQEMPRVVSIRAGPNGKPMSRISYATWDVVEELLFTYELKLKRLMAKHKISSPESSDPTRAATN